MKKFVVYCCMLFSVLASAQEVSSSNCLDIVYLKDGSKLIGKVTELLINQHVTVQTSSGITVKVESKYLKKVIQECDDLQPITQPVKPLAKGYYAGLRFQFYGGENNNGNTAIGLGTTVKGGYRVNKKMGIGVSLGSEKLSFNDEKDVISYPFLLEYDYYFGNNQKAPVVNFGIGYGLVTENDDLSNFQKNIVNFRGGLAYHLMAGFSLSTNLKLNIGLKIQHKKMYWINNWDDSQFTNFDKIINRRMLVGIEYIW